MTKSISFSYFLLLFALLFNSCQQNRLHILQGTNKGNNNTNNDITLTYNGTGTLLNIYLTDAPIELDEVNIDLKAIYIKGDGITDSLDLEASAGVYNLLDYQNGLSELISSTTITADTITEIRLILGEDNTVVQNGVAHPLVTPSAQQSGLKIKLCLPLVDVSSYNLTLDFVACESVHQTGNGVFKLRPVIKVVNEDAVCEDNDDDDDDDDEPVDDDDDLTYEDLPLTVTGYLAANYADAIIDDIESGSLCDDATYYVITLEDEENGDALLYFDESGSVAHSGERISNNDIPVEVLTGLETLYPGANISGNKSWLIGEQYLIKLTGNTRVLLDATGTLVCEL